MKLSLIISFILFNCLSIFAANPLLVEYDLLYSDLKNYNTVGYKSYFNNYSNITSKTITFTQGSLGHSGNKFDFAIDGKGFFKIYDTSKKQFYLTRNGAFKIDSKSRIVTHQGFLLFPVIKLINDFLPKSILCDSYGTLYMKSFSKPSHIKTYKINLYRPKKYAELIRVDSDFYKFKTLIKISPKLHQGFLETSTVNINKVTTRMLFILNEIKITQKNTIPGLVTKIFFLKQLLSNHNISMQNLLMYKKLNTISSHILRISDKIKKVKPPLEYDKFPNISFFERAAFFSFLDNIIPFLERKYK